MDIFIIITLAALLAAAGMAWYVRRSDTPDADRGWLPENLSREDFALLIREHYVRLGYSLIEHPTGGADFEIERDGHRQLVDFVEEQGSAAGEQAVREFHTLVVERKAHGGILVSASSFTSQARSLASHRNIDLIDGARLRQLVEAARNEDGELTVPRPVNEDESTSPRRLILCPVCGRTMVKRFERRDGQSRAYYGCVHAPQCKGRRDIA